MFTILVSRTFQKQFQKLDGAMKKRVRKGISQLEQDPKTSRVKADIKIIEGTEPTKRRLRVGDYRIIYVIVNKIVKVIEIFHRGRGY
ncbi:MAG: type II toxin-antitoxin system mRNA interferase toxin, RelE/StbE family [Thermoplasmata archaeon]|nr:type II toxin-antitoxin system mRNA interferase toxin, RelE/StbE family [Thermoplasmata archaeon]